MDIDRRNMAVATPSRTGMGSAGTIQVPDSKGHLEDLFNTANQLAELGERLVGVADRLVGSEPREAGQIGDTDTPPRPGLPPLAVSLAMLRSRLDRAEETIRYAVNRIETFV